MRTFSAFFVVLVVIVCASVPSPANADIKEFFPKVSSYTGDLELNMNYDSEKDTSNGKGFSSSDLFSRQRFNFHFDGYIYHPKFILYLLSLSTGIKEENYTTTGISSGWATGKSLGYNFRTIILPEHPYNLELFTTRFEPLSRQALSNLSSVTYTKGAIFRYKKKPYFANLSYVDATDESSDGAYNSSVYNGNVSYYKEYVNGKLLSLGASFNRRESSSSFSSFRGTGQDASLVNAVVLRNLSVDSGLSYDSFSQQGTTNNVTNDTLSWREGVHATLPWNLRTNLNYGLSKGKEASTIAGSPKFNSNSTDNNLEWDITHRLYQSLTTSYGFGYDTMRGSSGDSTMMSHSVGFSYTKTIPWGRLLAGANYTLTDVTNQGAPQIVNEQSLPVALGEGFSLKKQDVDVSTVVVSPVDPFPPHEILAPLTENVNYTVAVIGRTVQITVFSLPADVPVSPDGKYTYSLSYTLIPRNNEFGTTNISYNVRADLFNNLVTPYYNHFSSKQKELSGDFTGPAFQQTQDTFGLIVSKAPYTFMGEYTNAASNITPYRQWKTELRYMKDMSFTTRVQATASYVSTNYSVGTDGSGQPYTDNFASIDAGMQQNFPKKNITLSVSGSYGYRNGLSNASVYGGSAAFTWHTKKLLLSLGGTMSSSTSEYKGMNSKRLTEYYYLTLKRRLF